MTELKNNQTLVGQHGFTDAAYFRDFLIRCADKWYIFALSVAVICIGAAFHIASTTPTYTSSACIVIKQDRRTGGSGLESSSNSFSNIGNLFSQQTNVHNEILAFQSPTLMEDVVNRMDLRANYMTREQLHYKTLYGSSLPVAINVLDLPGNKPFELTINYSGVDGVRLSEMTTYISGEKVVYGEDLFVAFRDTVNTPVGRIVAMPNIALLSEAKPFKPILMRYISFRSAVRKFSSCLTVELATKEATAIALTVNDSNPERACDMLSCIIDAYNAKWVGDRNKIAVSTSEFITERLGVIEKELGSVDSDISDFKARNLILDPQAAGSMYMSQASRIQMDIMDLNNRLNVSRYIRDYIASSMNNHKLLPANSGMDNSNIESQISEFNTIQMQRNNLVTNSSEQNPVVVKMDINLEAMRGSILESLDNYMVILGKQIAALEHNDAQNNRKITDSPRQTERLTDIERQQKVKESLYLYLLQKREENELSQAFTAYNTRVITDPVLNPAPVSPKKSKIMLIALLIGLALPAVVIYLVDAMDTKLRTRRDLDNLAIPFVGEIPMAYKPGKLDFLLPFRKRKEEYTVVVEPHNRNVINEAFRVVRSNLEFICGEDSHRVLQMTSFNPGSGKTFITANICSALALKGQKVCSVDLDLRKAQLSSYVNSPSCGVAEYLVGSEPSLEKIIIKDAVRANWDVIPVGTIPPNPSELLYNPRLETMIKYLREKYDYVFLDCPPVEMVADPAIINRYTDRTIFVVRAGLLEKDLLPEVDKMYAENKLQHMMLLMNGTSVEGHAYYGKYGYGGYYSYGYYNSKR